MLESSDSNRIRGLSLQTILSSSRSNENLVLIQEVILSYCGSLRFSIPSNTNYNLTSIMTQITLMLNKTLCQNKFLLNWYIHWSDKIQIYFFFSVSTPFLKLHGKEKESQHLLWLTHQNCQVGTKCNLCVKSDLVK